jgi:hypothetical protein
MTEYINILRENKFLGLAVFDLVGSIAVSSFIGSRLGFDPIFSGLISIPISVAIHIVAGSDTILTNFFRSDSPHRYHGLAIGTATGIVSQLLLCTTGINSINVGLGIGILSTLYMRQYGHELPPYFENDLDPV